jgi:hypothetical protein
MNSARFTNPFSITKAVDLNDEQIENFWVSIRSEDDEGSASDLERPNSPMPTFILGAKGSGKTHLMRHQSFELQALRHLRSNRSVVEGVIADGYLGIYARCSGLQSGRFAGKRQTEEVWNEIFAYYFELWLAHHLLRVCLELQLSIDQCDELGFVDDVLRLFDRRPSLTKMSLSCLIEAIEELQKALDFEVNNCLLRGRLDVEITVTRGKLIFGIPLVLSRRANGFREILVSYGVDEFENLSLAQQVHVNTLVREREAPTTFRIGARTYGIRTHLTNSAGEENLRHSEYQEVQLDKEYRERKAQYKVFVRSLIGKRLNEPDDAALLNRKFESFSHDWDSDHWTSVVDKKFSPQRAHFVNLFNILDKMSVGNKTKAVVLECLVCPPFPVIEKLNALLLYQALSRGKDLFSTAENIHASFKGFLTSGDKDNSSYRQSMQHYKEDLFAQLLRENGKQQVYSGIDVFITMSSGIPRALLTILRSVYEWAEFRDEHPTEGGTISLQSQRKGVLEASNWYYHSMRKTGEDGLRIQSAVDRLANIMRINRFADKPVEVSLSAFSVSEHDLNDDARRILRLAESQAFLHRIPGGQRDKNSEDIDAKFQLSPMLAPRWDLPLQRRGTLALSPSQANSIFCFNEREIFDEFAVTFGQRLNAPFKVSSESSSAQLGLFE